MHNPTEKGSVSEVETKKELSAEEHEELLSIEIPV